MTKLKGKTPSLLTKSSGTPSSHSCGRKTQCSRCKEDILKNSSCFVIPKGNSGFSNKKPYCLKCFGDILTQTNKDIAALEKELHDFLSA